MGPREVDDAADDTGEMSDAGEAGGGRAKKGGRVRASTWFEQEPATITAIMAIANKTGTLCAGSAEMPAHGILLRFAVRFLLPADMLVISLAHASAGMHADRRASAEDGKAHADGAADDAGSCIVCR